MPATHQTVKLSRGKHDSPEHGVCVMELASMLAGESFTDQPASACPLIGSFLRSYNDQIDSRRRQDLYAYASRVVGSRMVQDVEQARLERLAEWTLELERNRLARFVLPYRWRRMKLARAREAVVTRAMVNVCRQIRAVHPKVMALLDELLLIGTPGSAPVTPPDAVEAPNPIAVTPGTHA